MDGKIKGASTIRSENIGKSMLTAAHDFAPRAAFSRKARNFKDRTGTTRLSIPAGSAIAHCSAHFGRSIAGRARP
jgi:hypothetical protein